MHAHVQRTGAAAGGDGVLHAQVGLECLLDANDVVVAVLSPAILGGVCGVLHLQLGDGGLGVGDFADLVAGHLTALPANAAALEWPWSAQCPAAAAAAPRSNSTAAPAKHQVFEWPAAPD